MADSFDLKDMLSNFRVAELQAFLGYAGRNKTGRKADLMKRAEALLDSGINNNLKLKIRELNNTANYSTNTNTRMNKVRYPVRAPPPDPITMAAERAISSIRRGNKTQHNRGSIQKRLTFSETINTQKIPTSVNAATATTPMAHQRNSLANTVVPNTNSNLSYGTLNKIMEHLPFYDQIDKIVQTSPLHEVKSGRHQMSSFSFSLQQRQINLLTNNKRKYQVQLRFAEFHNGTLRDDHFPSGIYIRLNNKLPPLPVPRLYNLSHAHLLIAAFLTQALIPTNKPGIESKRPRQPVDITNECKLMNNHQNLLYLNWFSSTEYPNKLDTTELLRRLCKKGIRDPAITKKTIIQKLSLDDADISTTSLHISLKCPLGKTRLKTACRGKLCTHLQCFDAYNYLSMNERKPTWMCPVCDSLTNYYDLIIDGLITEMLKSTNDDIDDIELLDTGGWKISVPNVVTVDTKESKSEKAFNLDIQLIDDDSKDIINKDGDCIDLTNTDSEDELPTKNAINNHHHHHNIQVHTLSSSNCSSVSNSDRDSPMIKYEFNTDHESIALHAKSNQILISQNGGRATNLSNSILRKRNSPVIDNQVPSHRLKPNQLSQEKRIFVDKHLQALRDRQASINHAASHAQNNVEPCTIPISATTSQYASFPTSATNGDSYLAQYLLPNGQIPLTPSVPTSYPSQAHRNHGPSMNIHQSRLFKATPDSMYPQLNWAPPYQHHSLH